MAFEEGKEFLSQLQGLFDVEVNRPTSRLIQPCPICGAYDPDLVIPPMPSEMFCSRCECCWGPYGGHGNINQKTVNYIVNGKKTVPLSRSYSLEEIIDIGLKTDRLRGDTLIEEVKMGGVDIQNILHRMTTYGNVGIKSSLGCLPFVLALIGVMLFTVITIIGLTLYG